MKFVCGEKLANMLQPLIEEVYLLPKKKKHTNKDSNGRYTNCIRKYNKKK